jgi:hypothetical protein
VITYKQCKVFFCDIFKMTDSLLQYNFGMVVHGSSPKHNVASFPLLLGDDRWDHLAPRMPPFSVAAPWSLAPPSSATRDGRQSEDWPMPPPIDTTSLGLHSWSERCCKPASVWQTKSNSTHRSHFFCTWSDCRFGLPQFPLLIWSDRCYWCSCLAIGR